MIRMAGAIWGRWDFSGVVVGMNLLNSKEVILWII
jgi:hypothetical protein